MANLVMNLRHRGIEATIVSVGGGGRIGEELAASGIPVDILGVCGPLGVVSGSRRLRRIVGDWRPHIIQGWMYHGNLLASLARPKGTPLVYAVRHSLPTLAEERPLTRVVIRLGAILSRSSSAIVYNTKASIPQHELLGYKAGGIWIPNGFDTERFKPDAAGRFLVRKELKIDDNTPLVGLIARFHPIKDHATFLRAVAIVVSQRPDARFILAGRGIEDARNGLRAVVEELRIQDSVLMLGDRSDVPALLNALDVACLTSRAEGFPNVVAEAMACGVPVVATNVGDVAEILGPAGQVVPPGDVHAVAGAVLRMLSWSPERRRFASLQARGRIIELFSEQVMLDEFEKLYSGLVQDAG